MAEARKCDICGKFYVTDEVGNAKMILIKYRKTGVLEKKDYYDLCTECSERILHQKGEESKEVTCATCGVPDLNCHEQCKEKAK